MVSSNRWQITRRIPIADLEVRFLGQEGDVGELVHNRNVLLGLAAIAALLVQDTCGEDVMILETVALAHESCVEGQPIEPVNGAGGASGDVTHYDEGTPDTAPLEVSSFDPDATSFS